MSDLTFETKLHPAPRSPEQRAALMVDPGFGRVFTDHMVMARYTAGRGWHDAELKAREAIPLDPAAAVLHYAQEIFEGLKAYRTSDGGAALFRPEANAKRFAKSAERMAMAPFPEDSFVAAMKLLVKADRDWIPDTADGSLYLRPFHDRQRGLPRREAGLRIPVPDDRFGGRLLLQGPDRHGHRLGLGALHPRGTRRHRGRQVRRQLCG